MKKDEISKFIALILRHRPEEIGITLDAHGWASVDALVAGISRTVPFTRSDLEEIVRTDSKQRYAFNEDHTLIRASQGHSVPVDVQPEKKDPPDILYHGTGEKYLSSILKEGLLPKSRLYVHLSADIPTALRVGERHGAPRVLEVDAKAMREDGLEFFLSANHV